jgi:hypothetical protein
MRRANLNLAKGGGEAGRAIGCKNYNTINILRTAKSSYFWFKRDSYPKYANNSLRIYTYSTMRPSNY